jgi:hypothetical protein
MTDSGAALVIWSVVAPAALDDFRAWHNREHLPERIAIPGILRGRRFRALAQDNRFLALYDLHTVEVLAAPEYRAVVDRPSPWTLRILGTALSSGARAICRRRFAHGDLQGGSIAVWHWHTAPDETAITLLCAEALPAVANHPTIGAVSLLIADAVASEAVSTATNALGTIARPYCVLTIEGTADPSALHQACAALSEHPGLDGATGPDAFVLEASIAKSAAPGLPR